MDFERLKKAKMGDLGILSRKWYRPHGACHEAMAPTMNPYLLFGLGLFLALGLKLFPYFEKGVYIGFHNMLSF